MDSLIGTTLGDVMPDVCNLTFPFAESTITTTFGSTAPPDFSSAANLADLLTMAGDYLGADLLDRLQDDMIDSLPDLVRGAVRGMEIVMNTVEPLLDAFDGLISGFEAGWPGR